MPMFKRREAAAEFEARRATRLPTYHPTFEDSVKAANILTTIGNTPHIRVNRQRHCRLGWRSSAQQSVEVPLQPQLLPARSDPVSDHGHSV
jgi:hypothetical protein